MVARTSPLNNRVRSENMIEGRKGNTKNGGGRRDEKKKNQRNSESAREAGKDESRIK